MKRHYFGIGLIVATVVVSVTAWEAAAGRLIASPTVVGTVDVPRVLDALDELKAEVARSKAAAEDFQQAQAKRMQELEALNADLEDYVVGTPKHDEAQRLAKKAVIDLRAAASLAQMREQRTEQRAMLRVYNHIREASEAVSKRDGYGLIIMDDSAIPIPDDSRDVLGDISARRVLYASNTLDVTQLLIDYLNEQWQAVHGN